MALGKLSYKISADISDLNKSLSSVKNSMKSVGESTSGISKSMEGASKSVGGFGSKLKDMVGAAVVFKGISAGISEVAGSVSSAVARFDTLQAFPKVMNQMGFSAEDTAKSVSILKKGVDGLPTSLQDLTKSAQSFAILEKSATGGAKTASALNDAFLASGATAEDASRGVQQYSQMLASGTVDLMSWRTLQETMPYALTKVANSFGLTGKSAERDLYAKLKAGDITMDQLNKRFIELDGGAKGFANTARTATGGIGTSFTNMRNAVTNGMADMISNVNDGLKNAGVENGIAGMFDKVKTGIKTAFVAVNGVVKGAIPTVVTVFQNIWTTVSNVMGSIDWNSLMGTFSTIVTVVGDTLSPLKDVVSNAFTAVSDVITTLKPLGQWLLDSFLTPLANWTMDTAKDALQGLADVLKKVGDWVSDNKDTVSNMTIVIGSFALAWGVVTAAVTAWNIVAGIATAVTTALGTAIAFLTSPIGIAIVAIGTVVAVGVLLYKNWDQVSKFITDCWNTIASVASSVWNSIVTIIIGAWTNTVARVRYSIDTIKTGVSNGWNAVKSVTSSVWNTIKSLITTPIKAAWSVVSGIIDKIKSMFNFKLKFPEISIPKIPLPHFSMSGSFNPLKGQIPKIGVDWYATGGIFSGPSMIGVGEAGDEAVLPLSNKSKMKPFAQTVSGFMKDDTDNGSNYNSSQPLEHTFNITVNSELDGRKVAESTVRYVQPALERYSMLQDRKLGF